VRWKEITMTEPRETLERGTDEPEVEPKLDKETLKDLDITDPEGAAVKGGTRKAGGDQLEYT
jgi:hypothetical protein